MVGLTIFLRTTEGQASDDLGSNAQLGSGASHERIKRADNLKCRPGTSFPALKDLNPSSLADQRREVHNSAGTLQNSSNV
ncbi:Fc.00g030320.m01.CDS01 [Cosmosporella sp. VM-42]